MLHTTNPVIKYKAGLLNLAEELSNVSKACKITGVSRDTFYRYRELADAVTPQPPMTPVKLRLAMASMGRPETKVSSLYQELGITRQTLYRHISPHGQLRADGIKLLNRE